VLLPGIVLLQVLSITPVTDSRQPVATGPLDLGAVASRVHLNLKALEGWVPKKGTPAPPIDWASLPPPPMPPERPIIVVAPPEPREPSYLDEGVNPAWGAPIPFWGSYGYAPRPRHHGRSGASRGGGAFRRDAYRGPMRSGPWSSKTR
jgi:hypothetical protein